MEQRNWSSLSESYKEELKGLWQNSSGNYQDNYIGFKEWLLDNYNIILDNKEDSKKDNIKIVLAVMLFIIVIVIITAVIYNFSVNNDNDPYNDSDYNTNYNSNYNNNYNHKITYYCDSGYTLINNQCHKKDVINATIEYQCYSGSLRGTECITETSHLAYTNKTCPYGYVLMGGDCIVIGTHIFSSNCNFNETYNSITNTCHRKIKPTEEYQCYSGTLRFNKCIIETKIPATIVYTCPIGYIQNNSICTKDIIIPAKIK